MRLSALLCVLCLPLLILLAPLSSDCLPAAISHQQLRPIDRTNVFDQQFLQKALQGQIPGVDSRFILDLAYWFHHTAIPCCERLLTQTGTRGVYNCTSLPEPTDHSSTVFLYRMVFECIGEQRNVSDCCWAKGVRSERCLQLCDSSHPMGEDAFESDDDGGGGGLQLMAVCAQEQRMPKERFLWMLFGCMNADFARIMQLTQMMHAEEARQKQLQGRAALV